MKNVFVKIEEYREIMQILDQTQKKLDEAKNMLATLSELKTQEDQHLAKWASELHDVEKTVQIIGARMMQE